MSDNQTPISSMTDNKDQRNHKDENPDANVLWGGRPKYVSAGTSKFAVNDSVYYQVGTAMYGPYLIAKISRPQVYILCNTDGDCVNNGVEFVETSLLKAP
ncbi:hypothetical protein GGS24DRAFT_486242 [Hypoxylon argillaceum]|nr:hypothetical protein GGS24DRAFT_486242 [Hypoxylon argillaceum]